MKRSIILSTLKLANLYLGKAVADGLMSNCARPVESAFKQVTAVIEELESEAESERQMYKAMDERD